MMSDVRLVGLGLLIAVVGAPSAAVAAAPAADGIASVTSVRRLISEISAEQGVDPRLVHAVIQVESGYDTHAVSRKGALGLMQLMPATARRLAVDDPFNPADNIRGGVQELARLMTVYRGDLPLALAAYNAGEGAVSRFGGVPPYAETNDYVDRIMSLYLGRPYHGGRVRSAPVRLVRSDGGGGILITNQDGAARTRTDLPRLSGGIAVSQPGEAPLAALSGGFGGASR